MTKAEKIGKASKKDPKYLAFIRTLPCCICYSQFFQWGIDKPEGEVLESIASNPMFWKTVQRSRTEAAHIGFSDSKRGRSQKHPDDECLPLCGIEHHREGKFSIHRMGADAFFPHYGLFADDRDLAIEFMQRLYEESKR